MLGFTADFTNMKIGTLIPYVDTEMEIISCPYCSRAGLDLRDEIGIVSHVMGFSCSDTPENSRWSAPFWSSDLCQKNGHCTIAYPAISIKTRVRHAKEPEWTQEQIYALKNTMETGSGPTGYGLT